LIRFRWTISCDEPGCRERLSVVGSNSSEVAQRSIDETGDWQITVYANKPTQHLCPTHKVKEPAS